MKAGEDLVFGPIQVDYGSVFWLGILARVDDKTEVAVKGHCGRLTDFNFWIDAKSDYAFVGGNVLDASEKQCRSRLALGDRRSGGEEIAPGRVEDIPAETQRKTHDE